MFSFVKRVLEWWSLLVQAIVIKFTFESTKKSNYSKADISILRPTTAEEFHFICLTVLALALNHPQIGSAINSSNSGQWQWICHCLSLSAFRVYFRDQLSNEWMESQPVQRLFSKLSHTIREQRVEMVPTTPSSTSVSRGMRAGEEVDLL